MSDLISRQAAIDAVFSLCEDCDSDYCGSCRVNYPGEKDARKALEDLPSAQPEQSSEIQNILEYLDTVLHPIVSPDHWNVYSELHDMISMLASAQPEIIRCNDCKWCEDADGLMCKNPASWVVATDYDFGCVLAERRQDG